MAGSRPLRALLVVGDIEFDEGEVRRRLSRAGLDADFVRVRDVLFRQPASLRAELPKDAEEIYDIIILPGSYPWNSSLVSPKAVKGAEGLGLLLDVLERFGVGVLRADRPVEKSRPDIVRALAADTLARLRAAPELIPASPPPVRVMTEVTLEGDEDEGELVRRAEEIVEDGADVVVLAPLTDKAAERAPRLAARLRAATGAPLGLDGAADVQRACAGAVDVLLSARPAALRSMGWAKGKYVVVLVDDDVDAAGEAVSEAASLGLRPVLDPVLRPPIAPGLRGSLARLERLSGVPAPKMAGLSNALELMDADTSGSAAMLLFLLAEYGVSAVLVEEASDKARGLTAEARRAADMASLAMVWSKPPKDVGVSLLNSKLKSLLVDAGGARLAPAGRSSVAVSVGGREVRVDCKEPCPLDRLAGLGLPARDLMLLSIAVYRSCLPWSSAWTC
mgnify:CR=1 FL=1